MIGIWRQFISWFAVEMPTKIILPTWSMFMRWGVQFFSLNYLPAHFLDPWHRDLSGYGRGFDLKRILHVLGWNLISRVLGAILRFFVILFGLVVELILFVVWLAIFIFWYLSPALIIFFLITGLSKIF